MTCTPWAREIADSGPSFCTAGRERQSLAGRDGKALGRAFSGVGMQCLSPARRALGDRNCLIVSGAVFGIVGNWQGAAPSPSTTAHGGIRSTREGSLACTNQTACVDMNQFMKILLTRPPAYPNWHSEPEVRAAVEWFKTFMTAEEWEKRREAAARRLYAAALRQLDGPDDKGRFFDPKDSFGWYLFLAEAYVDHPWNYDPTFGSRVVPLFHTIGLKLDRLRGIANVDKRVQRMVDADRGQPNGALFELLVAGAYLDVGAAVAFIEEKRGGGKTPDMEVVLDGRRWVVECKRLELPEYYEKERAEARRLWQPASMPFVSTLRSALLDVSFKVELEGVPTDYLADKALRYLEKGGPILRWRD